MSKGRSGSGVRATSGQTRTRSTSPIKDAEKKDQEDAGTGVGGEVWSGGTPAGGLGNRPHGMKRTRSHGLGISILTANNGTQGSLAVGSPLKAVMGPDGDDPTSSHNPEQEGEERTRKKSRLSNGSAGSGGSADGKEVLPRVTRRATTSPDSGRVGDDGLKPGISATRRGSEGKEGHPLRMDYLAGIRST
jgi:hypothetical protein